MIKNYFRKIISPLAWTQELIQLFIAIKTTITSSPDLAHYDPDKPTFLKIDWSTEGMRWILIQSSDDLLSKEVTKTLLSGGKFLFRLTQSGTRLQPISFVSRACIGLERQYHSFVGEAACGCYTISQNKLY